MILSGGRCGEREREAQKYEGFFWVSAGIQSGYYTKGIRSLFIFIFFFHIKEQAGICNFSNSQGEDCI